MSNSLRNSSTKSSIVTRGVRFDGGGVGGVIRGGGVESGCPGDDGIGGDGEI